MESLNCTFHYTVHLTFTCTTFTSTCPAVITSDLSQRPWLSLQISVRWKSGAHLWDALVNYLVQDDLEDNYVALLSAFPINAILDMAVNLLIKVYLWNISIDNFSGSKLYKLSAGDNRQFMMASAWERDGSKLQRTWVLLVVHITWISQKSISIPGVNKVNLE